MKKKKKLGKKKFVIKRKNCDEWKKQKRIIRKDMNEGMKEEKLNETKEIKMIVYFTNIERETEKKKWMNSWINYRMPNKKGSRTMTWERILLLNSERNSKKI